MADQYVATDKRTGLEVTVSGQFPSDHEDRIRIARTTNLFTRLMSSILSTEDTTELRFRFRALETQLELADALARQDMAEANRLMRETLTSMGVTDEHLRRAGQDLREQFEKMTGQPMPEELARALGMIGQEDEPDISATDDLPPEADGGEGQLDDNRPPQPR